MSQEPQIDLLFSIQDDWSNNGGFTGNISITNNGQYFEDWTIEFDATFEIKKIWKAEIVSHVGNHYVIKNGRWNGKVDPGETTNFGFSAYVDNQTITEPINYIFNQRKLDISPEENNEETPINPTNNNFIGEIGKVTDLNHLGQRIQLNNQYVNPVIFALPLSYNGKDTAIARITDIQNNNFSIYLQEPEDKNGSHTQETFSYLVLEAGIWELNDGTIIEVGNIDTNNTTSSGWETINFTTNFSETPVILSQVQTDNDNTFVRTRQHQANNNSFQLALEEEEKLKQSGHDQESVGWLAIETGEGAWNGMEYQAGTTGRAVNHKWYDLSLNNFAEAPNLLAGLGTYNGKDSAGLRYRNLDSNKVQIRVEEDTGLDQEIKHTKEVVNFLAIEGTGNLTGTLYDDGNGGNSDDNSDDNNTPFPAPTLSNQAIAVGFEQHDAGTQYNQSAQSQDWDVDWVNEERMDNYAFITDSEVYSGEKALRITYSPDARTGGSAAWKLPAEKEYYLSYWIKFSDDFDFDGSRQSGGKLPGLAGAGGYCSGGQTCNGNNGFSSRYMWGENGKAKLYLYHMNKPTQWGENFWFKDSDGNDKYFERGQWHNLIQRVKINDGNQSNGEIDMWMDGEQVISLDELKFVTNDRGIDAMMFSTFHGGSTSDWWPEHEVYSYFDNFVISTNASDVGL